MRWPACIALAVGLLAAGPPGIAMGSAASPGTVLVVSSNGAARPGVTRASLFDVATGASRVIFRSTSLCCTGAWSPDGRWIALAELHGVVLLRGDGRRPRPLPQIPLPPGSTSGQDTSFGWAPDSRSLAINEAGGHELVIRGLDGRIRVIRRTGRTAVMGAVTWSPDGHWISYDRDDLGGANGVGCCSDSLHLIHPDGSGDHIVAVMHDAIHDAPSPALWAPRGHRFAFSTEGFDARDPARALVDADSGKVTPLRMDAGLVAWVAGGIISQGFPNGRPSTLSLIDASGQRHPLATILPPSGVAASSAEAASLVVAGAETRTRGGSPTVVASDLELVDLTGGPPRVLTHLPKGTSVEVLSVRPGHG